MVPGATPHWNSIGIELRIDSAKIAAITKSYPANYTRCCFEMFDYWLRTNPQATWKKLLDALESKAVALNALAYDIRTGKCAKY